jgi:hypothetical protein
MTARTFPCVLLLALAWLPRAEARPGTVTWSDGKKLTGDLTLTPGKQLKIFAGGAPVELPLEETRQLRFSPEKETMQDGFYFPNAGQATQAKTGDVYPLRYIHTQIVLPDGRTLEGHLFTTVLYVQNADGTQKVVLEAKQTGADGQKLADLPYPVAIDFSDSAAGASRLDLSHETIPGAQTPVVIVEPQLAPVSLQPGSGPQNWTLPSPDPQKLLVSVQGSDGLHVGWPALDADPAIVATVQTGLKTLQDFYDTRTLLGTQASDDDVYSLVMMQRRGKTYSFATGKIPWSLVVLHWKYDADANKVSLVNRASLAMGRATDAGSPPPVLKTPALMNDILPPIPNAP